MMKDTARGFSLFEEAWLISKAKDSNVEPHTKIAAAFQNTIQCYRVIYDEKKRATTQTSLDCFFKRVNRIESSKEPEPVPSMSGESENAACPPPPVADGPSALLLPPPPPPPISNFSCCSLNARACMPAACCTVLLYFSRYFPVILKMLSLFFVFFCFLGIIACKPIIVKYYIADCVSWAPRLSLLNSWTHWTYECALEMEFVHMYGT